LRRVVPGLRHDGVGGENLPICAGSGQPSGGIVRFFGANVRAIPAIVGQYLNHGREA
jgi:hypothetical protein